MPGVGADAQAEVDIPYFANRPVLSLHGLLAHSASVAEAQSSLTQSLAGAWGAGRNVYVLGEIWTARDSVKGLQKQSGGLDGPRLRSLFAGETLSPAWIGPRGQVWRVSRTPAPRQRTTGDAE